MKKLILLTLVMSALAVFSVPSQVMAQDIYNQPVRFDTTKSYDNWDVGFLYLNYGGSFNWSDFGDSSLNIHTKPMLIGNANALDGFISVAVVSGYAAGTDFQVIPHYSNDLLTWTAQAAADGDLDLDHAGQYITDTLGTYNGANDVKFHGYKWMSLEFDGQTANVESQIVQWTVGLRVQYPVQVNGQPLLSIGNVASKSQVNP